MKKFLVIKSSILAANSRSNQLVDFFTSKINADITERDVAANPIPHFDLEAEIASRGTPETEAQKQALALSDSLVAELKAHDVLVFGVPMYDLNIPSQLKAYLDNVCRAGVTFRYGPNGAEGLVTGKKAIVVLTYGGQYKGTNIDITRLYMQTVLGFLGITDVEFVAAEGLNVNPELCQTEMDNAKVKLAELAATL